MPQPAAKSMTPSVQNQTNQFIKQTLDKVTGGKPSNIAVFDDANVQDHLRDSGAPQVVQDLMAVLPETVTFAEGAAPYNTASLVMDSIAKSEAMFAHEHGHAAPAWVADDALRSTLPLVSKNYAEFLGLPSQFLGSQKTVFDDVNSASGGAMSVSQVLTAIVMAYSEPMPFSGRIAMDQGLEGRVILVGHRAAAASGDYAQYASLDGLNAGKPFLMSQRMAQAVDTSGTWAATIKNASVDAAGSPILPSAVGVYVNGLLVGQSNPMANRSDTTITFSQSFHLPGTAAGTAVTVTGNATTGVLSAVFTPALASGSVVEFSAAIDFEHANMKGKRPVVESHATIKSIRATYASALYSVSQEARHQWAVDVKLDQSSQNMAAIRTQSVAERHHLAVRRMWRIASAHVFNFEMDKANRMNERSITSIMMDLGQAIEAANLDMIVRTNLNGIGVIYVGASAASYLGTLPPEILQASNVKPRAGTYRLGRLLGKYELYFSPIPELVATSDGFPMLCIGTSDQAGANPYITGTALGAAVSPLATTVDGITGQFVFEAGVDTVNPHLQCADSAALINVKF
ncbi:hypothetical protein ADP71_17490 [Vitreoscilla sp. C1]|uniref:hypothetical protein n=1 Tax=Vitreoscilla sp. (strain C1) TaxID=96942 RepID=UPI000CDBF64D|nr:hypothetical protein [Vitreoscilla sp. C1]AUZ05276.1 hypothetical protein ADP71_17490 [Vitreoscilla sp. C1]